MRIIEPTPLTGETPKSSQQAVQKAAPSAGSGKRPWERFGPITLDFRPVNVNGIEVMITRIPAYTMVDGNIVFPPFSAIDALDFADMRGLALPTAEVFDAMRGNEWWHAPITDGYDPSGDMQSDSIILNHGRKWQMAMNNGYDGEKFIPNAGKAWIADAVVFDKPGYGINRGYWMTQAAKEPIQMRGQKHTAGYKDVAQKGIFVKSTPEYIEALESGAFGNKPFKYADFEKATRGQSLSGIEDIPGGSAVVQLLSSIWRFFTKSAGIPTKEPIQIKAWKGNEAWSDDDIREFVRINDANGINPADTLLVHLSETGGGPPSKWANRSGPNGALVAAGMMQWIRSTAKAIGADFDELPDMPVSEQLPILDAYLKRYIKGRGVRNSADMYMINFIGGLCTTASCAPKCGSKEYEHNKVLDLDRDCDIDLADLREQMARKKRQVWDPAPIRIVR